MLSKQLFKFLGQMLSFFAPFLYTCSLNSLTRMYVLLKYVHTLCQRHISVIHLSTSLNARKEYVKRSNTILLLFIHIHTPSTYTIKQEFRSKNAYELILVTVFSTSILINRPTNAACSTWNQSLRPVKSVAIEFFISV